MNKPYSDRQVTFHPTIEIPQIGERLSDKKLDETRKERYARMSYRAPTRTYNDRLREGFRMLDNS